MIGLSKASFAKYFADRCRSAAGLAFMLGIPALLPLIWSMALSGTWKIFFVRAAVNLAIASWLSVIAFAPQIISRVLSVVFVLLSLILAGAESVHLWLFGSRMNDLIFFSILNTHVAEVVEFVSEYFGWRGGAVLVVFTTSVVMLLKAQKLFFQFLKRMPRALSQLQLLGGGLGLFFVLTFNVDHEFIFADSIYRPIIAVYDYFQGLRLYREAEAFGARGQFARITRKPAPDREVYVLIIGESTTRSHLGIYGYYRPTTPRLAAIRDELEVFTDAISPHCHTHSSLKASLSFYENAEPKPFSLTFSIVDLMNQAGFKTYWISNQVAFGRWNTPVGTIGIRSTKALFLNPERYQLSAGNYDETVLEPLKHALEEPDEKKFIVLHLRGTHLRYQDRYPIEFETFHDAPRSCIGALSDVQSSAINQYDDAVRYTDYIVGSILDILRQREEYAAALFFSDHGEEVFDLRDFRGHDEAAASPWMFEIPMILWTTPAYRERNPEILAAAEANRAQPFVTGRLVHSLEDLTGTFSDRFQAQHSIFNSQFRPVQDRMIGGVPYDSAIAQPDYLHCLSRRREK